MLMDKKDVKEELKSLFRSYRHMTPKISRGLLALGITMARRRNHVILLVNGNSVSIGSTVSDRRVGKKIVTSIMNYL